MNDAPPLPRPKEGMGCFAKGCLTLVVVVFALGRRDHRRRVVLVWQSDQSVYLDSTGQCPGRTTHRRAISSGRSNWRACIRALPTTGRSQSIAPPLILTH